MRHVPGHGIGGIYKDYVLTMLFLKYISDVWQDHYDSYEAYGDTPDLIGDDEE